MNNKYIIVGIDGTGSRDWMNKDGSNSSTYKFINDVNYGAMGIDREWYHGSSDIVFGSDSIEIVQKALDFIYQRVLTLFPEVRARAVKPLEMFDVNSCMQNHERTTQQMMERHGFNVSARKPVAITAGMLDSQPLTTDDVRVVLIGHSRGGLAVTTVARMLSPLVRVYFMGLYDAVDRQQCLDGMNVENVKYVAHARRRPEVKSRTYFGNTSYTYIGVDHVAESFFYTSHGGVGGSYVTDPKEVSLFTDTSCLAIKRVYHNAGPRGTIKPKDLTNNPALVKEFGKKMDQLCAEGSDEADKFMRAQAQKYGIPVS